MHALNAYYVTLIALDNMSKLADYTIPRNGEATAGHMLKKSLVLPNRQIICSGFPQKNSGELDSR